MESTQKDGQSSAKKRYERPVLTEYGSVAKLTQATISGATGDGGVHPSNMRV